MTKEMLQSYRSKKDEIAELDWVLRHRWQDEGMIGNNVVFDYRKGYPRPQSVVGFDYDRYDRLQDRDNAKKALLEQECAEIEEFVESIPDSLTRRIFRMSFIDGRKQKYVAKAVHLDQSRVSRRIDDYLKTHSTHKKHMYNNTRASRHKANGCS